MVSAKNKTKTQHNPAGFGFRWLIVLTVLFGQLLIYTWVRTETRHAMIDLSKARIKLTQAGERQKNLNFTINRLIAENRIREIAVNQLYLLSESNVPTIYLNEGDW